MPKIKIEKELYDKIKQVVDEVGYSSVEEFINHILERTVNPPGQDDEDEDLTKRLQGLGYIS